MSKTLDRIFGGMPQRSLIGSCIALVAIVALVDHATGYEASLSIFYLLPIGIASWYGKRPFAYWIALASALVWLVVDFTAGHSYSSAIIPFWNAAVRLGFFTVVVYLLVALRRQLTGEIENARTDQLTGLANSRGFMSDAERLWSLAIRHGHTTSLAHLDLDNFKQVNDVCGHAEGDVVLGIVADTLSKSLRQGDVLGRMGGDDFAALLPEADRSAATEVGERVRAELLRVAQDRGWPIAVSMGVKVFHPPYPALDQALRAADDLMYRAKRGGKNRVLVEEDGDGDRPADHAPEEAAPKRAGPQH